MPRSLPLLTRLRPRSPRLSITEKRLQKSCRSASTRHPNMIISKTQPAIPDWLPDWTKPDQYPDPKTTSSRQWAWEFLRRNPEYQRLWDELIAPHFDPKVWYNDQILEILRNDEYQRRWNELIPPESHSEVFEQRFGIRSFPPPHSMS